LLFTGTYLRQECHCSSGTHEDERAYFHEAYPYLTAIVCASAEFSTVDHLKARDPNRAGDGFDVGNSSGGNLGPISRLLNDAIKKRIDACRKENGLKETDTVPDDAVTASGSGLDPHIGLQDAQLQAAQVVKARSLALEKVRASIRRNTGGPELKMPGEPVVNVLLLNRTLDSLR
jgi:K+-transporting ATPase KdpC subunit